MARRALAKTFGGGGSFFARSCHHDGMHNKSITIRKEFAVGLYSHKELDIKAKAAVLALIRHIDTDGLVENICSSYRIFCSSPEAQTFKSKYRNITEGVPARVFFEILCFAAFLVTVETEKYVEIKKLFRKKTDYDSINYFNSRLITYLHEQCKTMEISKFSEIVLLAPPPDIKIKYGDSLDPVRRLSEYSTCQETGPEATKQQLSICLSKTIDPLNYHILNDLWGKHVKVLVAIADNVIAGVFKPPVKLKNASAF